LTNDVTGTSGEKIPTSKEWPLSNLASARFKKSTMGKLAILKFKMARVSVKMEIEKYEAHWAQAKSVRVTQRFVGIVTMHHPGSCSSGPCWEFFISQPVV
jgi:hypothetical protein